MCALKEKENGHHDVEHCLECQIDRNSAKLVELARQRKATEKAKKTAITVLQKHLEH
jgi:hypothetical protein